MKPTAIWITGTYDDLADEPGDGTNFTPCSREDATHVSVYLINENESEPVQDFPFTGNNGPAYAEALTLASKLAHEHGVGIKDTFQKHLFRAPAAPAQTPAKQVCEADIWYAEAMAASNELGYAGMDAASVIRHLGGTLTALKEANGQMADKLKLIGSGPDAAYEKVEELKNLLMRAQSHVTAPGLYAAIEEALK